MIVPLNLKPDKRCSHYVKNYAIQPRSQGLSSSHKRGWSKKDPGSGWSRALVTKLSSWEGYQFFRKLSSLAFVTLKTRLEQSPCFLGVFISSILCSSYWNVNLKPKQVKFLEAVYSGRDVVGVLPTGYGKSIIFHLSPALLFEKVNSAPPSQSSCTIHPIVIIV